MRAWGPRRAVTGHEHDERPRPPPHRRPLQRPAPNREPSPGPSRHRQVATSSEPTRPASRQHTLAGSATPNLRSFPATTTRAHRDRRHTLGGSASSAGGLRATGTPVRGMGDDDSPAETKRPAVRFGTANGPSSHVGNPEDGSTHEETRHRPRAPAEPRSAPTSLASP